MDSTPDEGWVIVEGDAAGFAQQITAGRHRLAGDEPTAAGGTGTGPTPYDLLLAALGSCTSMTVAMYARRKQWPLASVRVRLRHSRPPGLHALRGAETLDDPCPFSIGAAGAGLGPGPPRCHAVLT